MKTQSLEKRIGIPEKKEEAFLFSETDAQLIYDRYPPLIDHLLQGFVFIQPKMKDKIVKETKDALWKAVLLYKKNQGYGKNYSFATYFTFFFAKVINPYLKGGQLKRNQKLSRKFWMALLHLLERNELTPNGTYLPKIVQFLGYVPFEINLETMGGRIKQGRLLKGLNATGLAELLGATKCTVLRWERNVYKPKPEMLVKLNRVFGSNL